MIAEYLLKKGDFFVENYEGINPGSSLVGSSDAIQSCLNDAEGTGGTVHCSGRFFLIDKPLRIPNNVSFVGTYKASPSHTGYLPGIEGYDNYWSPGHDTLINSGGTILIVVCGQGNENDPPAFDVGTSAYMGGFSIWYMNQASGSETNPTPYPWCIHVQNRNNTTIENIELMKPYKGVYVEQVHSGLFRNINGQAIKTGFRIEGGGDVNRVENIHFSGRFYFNNNIYTWIRNNGTHFEIGREDLLNMSGCFAYGGGIGYRFFQSATQFRQGGFSPDGSLNGPSTPWCTLERCNLDDSRQNIILEAGQNQGIEMNHCSMICTNDFPTLQVTNSFNGSIQINGGHWYNQSAKYAAIDGSGLVTLHDIIMRKSVASAFADTSSNTGVTVAGTGITGLSKLTFATDQPHISVGSNITKGKYESFLWAGSGTAASRVTNNAGGKFIIT